MPAVYQGFALEYAIDRATLPEPLRGCAHELALDDQTRGYIDAVLADRAGPLRTRLHTLLTSFMSSFDVNALLGMYPLHLLSAEQLGTLLRGRRYARGLDVGAGSGNVTREIAPWVDRLETVETSGGMARSLRRSGFVCHRVDLSTTALPDPTARFDLITCLNVLDRCARPRSLLARVSALLAPGGTLVVASPLPYDPFFYVGGRTETPVEPLPAPGQSWGSAADSLARGLFEPTGLSVTSLSRLPYLSAGDTSRSLYVIDDGVFVLRRTEGGTDL